MNKVILVYDDGVAVAYSGSCVDKKLAVLSLMEEFVCSYVHADNNHDLSACDVYARNLATGMALFFGYERDVDSGKYLKKEE